MEGRKVSRIFSPTQEPFTSAFMSQLVFVVDSIMPRRIGKEKPRFGISPADIGSLPGKQRHSEE
jgi:hypothetical protein